MRRPSPRKQGRLQHMHFELVGQGAIAVNLEHLRFAMEPCGTQPFASQEENGHAWLRLLELVAAHELRAVEARPLVQRPLAERGRGPRVHLNVNRATDDLADVSANGQTHKVPVSPRYGFRSVIQVDR